MNSLTIYAGTLQTVKVVVLNANTKGIIQPLLAVSAKGCRERRVVA